MPRPRWLLVSLLLVGGCHPGPPRAATGPGVCRSLQFSLPRPDARSSIDVGGWRVESGLYPIADLVDCRPVSTASLRFREGALARTYEGRDDETGKLAQLGGNYWVAPYDIGAAHDCHLDTGGGGHRRAPGSLLSPKIAAGTRYVSLLVGGGGGAGTRIELCRVEKDDEGCSSAVAESIVHGPGTPGMERAIWDLRALGLESRAVRIRITIAARETGDEGLDFIVADDLASGAERPPPQEARLWGFVDLHAHLFNNLGSGGRLIHGEVFARCDPARPRACDDPGRRMERALGTSCVVNHGQGGHTFSTEPMAHGTRGYPGFEDWPNFKSISHQQAYIDWIERAYRGGLRLVQMDVGNNRTYAAAYEQLNGGIVPALVEAKRRAGDGKITLAADEDGVRAKELEAARLFVAPGGPASAWADIASSASEARRIARSGKMVIVPGLESDNPSDADDVTLSAAEHLPTYQARPVVRAYVERLWKEGVRHVFPVHVMPNVFGAPAVYDRTIYCAALPEQGALERLTEGMGNDIRYHVERDPGMLSGLVDLLMTNVLDPVPRSASVTDRNAALGSFAKADCRKLNFPDLRAFHSLAKRAVKAETYALQATMAARGLTRVGVLFVEESMRLGMIVDLTHMGDKSRDMTLAIARRYAYPVMASHEDFRELSFGNRERGAGSCSFAPPDVPFDPGSDEVTHLYGTSVIAKVGYEYAIRRSEVVAIRELGGMIGLASELAGVGVAWAPFGQPGSEATPLDCDGTSKSFAQPYRYLRDLMGGRGIAFGTDVNGFYMLPPPRFGAHACAGACEDALKDDIRCGPDGHGPGNVSQDTSTRVAYDDGSAPVPRTQRERMHPYRAPGGRKFDVNEEGVAHYGMLPDFLQDLVNVGVSPEELAPLFGGLEDYLLMWARCERQAEKVRADIP